MDDFKKHLESEKDSIVHNMDAMFEMAKTNTCKKWAKTYKATVKRWQKHLKVINKALSGLNNPRVLDKEKVKEAYVKAAK